MATTAARDPAAVVAMFRWCGSGAGRRHTCPSSVTSPACPMRARSGSPRRLVTVTECQTRWLANRVLTRSNAERKPVPKLRARQPEPVSRGACRSRRRIWGRTTIA